MQLPMLTMTLKPFPPLHQANIPPMPPTQINPTTAPRHKLAHLTRQPHRNMDNSNWRLPSTPMLQLPTQQTSHFPDPKQTTAPMREPIYHDESMAINPPSPYIQLNPAHETTVATAHSLQPHFSMMARMLLNNTHTNTLLWTPTAFQCCMLTQTMDTGQFTPCPDHVHSLLLLQPFTLTGATTAPTDEHDTCAHTSTKTTPPLQPVTCQCHHQNSHFITLAKHMKAFAHNMRPL